MSQDKFPRFLHQQNDNFCGERDERRGFSVYFKPGDEIDPVLYSIAYCSGKDQFNRKVGREVSKGRMDNGQYSTSSIEHFPFVLAEALFNCYGLTEKDYFDEVEYREEIEEYSHYFDYVTEFFNPENSVPTTKETV